MVNDPSQDSGSKRDTTEAEEDPFHLVVCQNKEAMYGERKMVPLKQVKFNLRIAQGYADMVVH